MLRGRSRQAFSWGGGLTFVRSWDILWEMKEGNGNIGLPAVIAAYWKAANAGAIQEAAGCFSPDAVVFDEGGTYTGTAAIRAWIEETTLKYHPTVEPLCLEEKDGRHHVTARVSGTFPGSPIELDYFFTLQDGRIIRLEIG